MDTTAALSLAHWAYKSVDDMTGVWIVGWLQSLETNELHDLVLSLTRNSGVRDDDLDLWARAYDKRPHKARSRV